MTPKTEMPKPDKYDEDGKQWAKELLETISDEIQWVGTGGISDSRWIEVVGAGIAMRLRSAFPSAPSVAEDAQEAALMVIRAYNTHVNDDPKEAAAAELEAFARSRVKPWREVLISTFKALEHTHWPPEHPIHHEADKARELLSADDAKEAAKEEREIKDLSDTVQFNDGMDD